MGKCGVGDRIAGGIVERWEKRLVIWDVWFEQERVNGGGDEEERVDLCDKKDKVKRFLDKRVE